MMEPSSLQYFSEKSKQTNDKTAPGFGEIPLLMLDKCPGRPNGSLNKGDEVVN